jgi:hypothetical protein
MARLPSNQTYNDLTGTEAVDILTDWFRHLLMQQVWAQPHITLPMAKLTLDCHVAVDMYPGGTVPVASPPEKLDIAGAFTLENRAGEGRNIGNEIPFDPATMVRDGSAVYWRNAKTETDLRAVVNAAPIPGGTPPDQIREQHGLPVPTPGYGPRDTGSHLFLCDVMAETERKGTPAEGYTFAQEAPPPPINVSGQEIPVDRGAITIRADGEALRHDSGMQVTAGTHYASVKTAGDQAGKPYGSTNAVLDAGPAGLMQGHMNRSKFSFGNTNRG